MALRKKIVFDLARRSKKFEQVCDRELVTGDERMAAVDKGCSIAFQNHHTSAGSRGELNFIRFDC